MRARLVAAALLLLAAAVYALVWLPANERVIRNGEALRRLHEERRQLAAALQPLEREDALRTAALARLGAVPLPEGHEAPLVRRAVLAKLSEAGFRGVRVSVRPGRGSAAALIGVQADGSLMNALRFSDDLVRPGSGVVFNRVRLAPGPEGISLELDASNMGRRP